jgi:putative transposase
MNKNFPDRQSIRLDDFDYSKPGIFFITICTQFHKCLFGEIICGKMVLNDAGQMVEKWWLKMGDKYDVKCQTFIIMLSPFGFRCYFFAKNIAQAGRSFGIISSFLAI